MFDVQRVSRSSSLAAANFRATTGLTELGHVDSGGRRSSCPLCDEETPDSCACNNACLARVCPRCTLSYTTTGGVLAGRRVHRSLEEALPDLARRSDTCGILARARAASRKHGLLAYLGEDYLAPDATATSYHGRCAGSDAFRPHHLGDDGDVLDREVGFSHGTGHYDAFGCVAFVGPGGYDDDWRSAVYAGKPAVRVGSVAYELHPATPMWVAEAVEAKLPISIEALEYCAGLERARCLAPDLLDVIADLANPELQVATAFAERDAAVWRSWISRLQSEPARAPAKIRLVGPDDEGGYDARTHSVSVPVSGEGTGARAGKLVLAPSGAGKSTLIREGKLRGWIDGDRLTDWTTFRGKTAEERAALLEKRVEDIESAVRSGSNVLVNVGDSAAQHRWAASGLLSGVWLPGDAAWRDSALKTRRLNDLQRRLLRDEFPTQLRELPSLGVPVLWGEEPDFSRTKPGVRIAASAPPADVVRALSKCSAAYGSKQLAPAHIAHTPGPTPTQHCLCPLHVAVDALLDAGEDPQALLDALLLRAGEPYDFVTAWILYTYGCLPADVGDDVARLMRLPFEEFRSLAKDASALVKRWGVPREWRLDASAAAELHCLGARGLGDVDFDAEAAHRRNLGFAAKLNPSGVAADLTALLNRGLAAAPDAPPLQRKWDRAAFWMSGGNQPAGSATLESGLLHIDGRTDSAKFRHTKKSYIEGLPADALAKAIESAPRIAATCSVKVNDPAKVRIIYGCDTTSAMVMSHALAPVEAFFTSTVAHLRPGAADELADIWFRLQALSNGLGFMYDFDDFNSQHSYPAMKACFQAILDSDWGQRQDSDYRAAVAWSRDALDDVTARMPTGETLKQPLGLMTGLRATSYLNTMLNYAHFAAAARAANLEPGQFVGQHGGDDVFGICQDRVTAVRLLAALKAQGARGQESKIAISREFGEFFRLRYGQDGVSGYPARTVASLASGNFMNTEIRDPRDKAATVAEHVALCVTRGMSPKLGSVLAKRLARYWGAVRTDDGWVAPPDPVLYARRSAGGLGLWLDGSAARAWARATLPDAEKPPSAVEFDKRMPRAATRRAVDSVMAELPSGLELSGASLEQALLEGSYGGSAIPALRAKLQVSDHAWLAAWYRKCARVPRPSKPRDAREDLGPDYALGLVERTFGGAAPHVPRLYARLSRHAGLQSAASNPVWRSPAGVRALLSSLYPETVADFDAIAAVTSPGEAAAFAWGHSASDYVAAFGVSRLFRDYAWLLYHVERLTVARGAPRVLPSRGAFSCSVNSAAYMPVGDIGLLRA